jgi:hypothetical protein
MIVISSATGKRPSGLTVQLEDSENLDNIQIPSNKATFSVAELSTIKTLFISVYALRLKCSVGVTAQFRCAVYTELDFK